MATIPINDTEPRNEYTATGGQTVFPYTFWITEDSDLKVYQNGTLLTLTTHYTVSDALDTDGGNVTLVTGATVDDEIVIVRDISIKRTTEFQTSGTFKATTLNLELSKFIAIQQQLESKLSRCLQLPPDSIESDANFYTPATLTDQRGIKWDSGTNKWIMTTYDPDSAQADAAASATAASSSATSAASSATAAASSASAAATSETNAAASEAAALAAVGGVSVSANDTTPANLEAKLLVGAGLSLSTQNDGGNETRTIDVDINGLTDATISASDEIVFGDVDDSNNMKKDTVQGILDLVPSPSTATTSAEGIVELATDAEVKTGTDTSRVPSVSSMVSHEGVVKCWVNFNTVTTTTVKDSYNVTSLTDNGTGDTTITIATDFGSANYACCFQHESVSGANKIQSVAINSKLAGSVRIVTYDGSSAGDQTDVSAIMIGDR